MDLVWFVLNFFLLIEKLDLNNYYDLLDNSQISYLTASTGMWHQSGTILNEGDLKGYYLTIESGEEDIQNSKGDLASELGFIDKSLKSDKNYGAKPLNSKKLGVFAKEKLISELIVDQTLKVLINLKEFSFLQNNIDELFSVKERLRNQLINSEQQKGNSYLRTWIKEAMQND